MFKFFKTYKKPSDPTSNHLSTGTHGENEAVKYLKKNKYKIIDRNVHVGKSEIDIIAHNKDSLVFIEVKTRTVNKDIPMYSRPAAAVNKSKIAYLIRGANGFIKENYNKYSDFYKRFDIIEVYLIKDDNGSISTEIKHFENAIN